MIEVAEPTDRRPTLSDIHISDAKDSHPNTASPLKMQTAEPEPPLNGDQLLQMISSMQKQMENQQMKMIRLRKIAAREKGSNKPCPDKMAVYAHNDLCRAFPSSLQGVAYHWF